MGVGARGDANQGCCRSGLLQVLEALQVRAAAAAPQRKGAAAAHWSAPIQGHTGGDGHDAALRQGANGCPLAMCIGAKGAGW